MTELRYSARAKLTLTIEVIGKSHWGDDATVAEVARIGGKETMNAIQHLIQDAAKDGLRITIQGEPHIGVIAISPEPKK
jgi:hypothetical protein